jgi:3-oxoacyl-[acyl-carrier-protein] synthase-3
MRPQKQYLSVVAGTGMCVPDKVVTNDDISKLVDTSDAWIVERTGIRERRISTNETVASLGAAAAVAALDEANVNALTVDAIILATTTPDHFMPATATYIQQLTGCKNAFAFDIQAVCSGFIYALLIADNLIGMGTVKNVLVIGSEVMSRMIDWSDRSTCILFADGAAAVLLTAGSSVRTEISSSLSRGILSTRLSADGSGYYQLYTDLQDGSPRGRIKMDGRSVYLTAIKEMEQSVRLVLAENELNVSDIDWFVPHQANKRIIDSVAEKLQLDSKKVILTIDKYANTSAATIPMALSIAEKDGRIKKNDIVVLSAMGAGFTWGAAVIRW